MKNAHQKHPKTEPSPHGIAANDRFSHLLFFTNELRDSRLREIKGRREARWNNAARMEKSAQIKALKPWMRSTGPKTVIGKSKSCQNALKHGKRSAAKQRLCYMLRIQSLFCQRLGVMTSARLAMARHRKYNAMFLTLKGAEYKRRARLLFLRYRTIKVLNDDKIAVYGFSNAMLDSMEKVMIHV